MVSGIHNDNWLARQNSVRLYGRLLEAGIEILEYNRTMLHQKTMVVDGVWATVGTTNFDNRSFAHNEENNVCFYDRELARHPARHVCGRSRGCDRVDVERWRRRGVWARLQEFVAVVPAGADDRSVTLRRAAGCNHLGQKRGRAGLRRSLVSHLGRGDALRIVLLVVKIRRSRSSLTSAPVPSYQGSAIPIRRAGRALQSGRRRAMPTCSQPEARTRLAELKCRRPLERPLVERRAHPLAADVCVHFFDRIRVA